MNPDDTTFTGSIPEVYDRCLVPLLFTPYAEDIANRARALGARRILEVAAGTGIVTRALAEALPDAEIEATDLNEAMVSFASARNAAASVRWSTADAMQLPFEDARFDLVVCQFAVMFFPDRPRAFRETRRVLAPGGTYLFNVWDGIEHNDVTRIVSDAVEAAFPDDPPRFMRRTPHGFGDPHPIERDLRDAGFIHVVWEAVAKRSVSSARDAAVGICEGSPLRHEIVARDPQRLPSVVDAAIGALQTVFGGNAVDGAMSAFVFNAT